MKVAIVGASGYVGQELMKLVLRHKFLRLEDAVSNSWSGKKISLLIGKNKETIEKDFISVDSFMAKYKSYDLIFLALPHGDCAKFYVNIRDFDGYIIDLSSDFRLSSKNRHMWKDDKHVCEEDLDKFVYGLADIDGDNIAKSKLIANPGCYATSILLATIPAIEAYKKHTETISIFSMSGVSGAGYKATMKNSYCEINENTYAYALKNHNHIGEIEDYILTKYDFTTKIQFTPHLIPINRGISSTCYINLDGKFVNEYFTSEEFIVESHLKSNDSYTSTINIDTFASELINMYKDFYKNSEFVYIVDEIPQVKDVAYTNQCHIYVDYDKRTNNIVIVSVIDNLMKGAASQAIQNVNTICRYSISEGLQGGYYENN
ncbi:MAG: Asd/ArgC dimerization domain-containing protein [Acidaminobacteraceae bacterium]